VIVAGMPRAGSTWLYYNFVKHPGVAMPKFKETFFFGSNFNRGFDWYFSLYDENASGKVAFDISPDYFCNKDFFGNVSKFDVDHKVVLVLREPAEWLVSLYSQIKSFTPNMPSIDDFLKEIKINFDGGSYTIHPESFDFSGVVERFIDKYRGRLLLINFNELKANPIRVLNEIEQFAGLERYFDEETAYIKPVNVSIPNFNLIAYLGTKRRLREVAVKVLPKIMKDQLVDYIYKINKQSDKNMSDVAKLEKSFKPLYEEKYFTQDNVVHF
jgi:hypothetical protein